MGVGTPLDLLEAVHRGVDMFDCILPTALAQQGMAFTSHGRIDLRRGVYKLAEQPLDARCDCEACTLYSRSYLHHLVKCKEPLGWQLLAFHNLRFYLAARCARCAPHIAADTFAAFYAERRADPRRSPISTTRRAGDPAARRRRARARGAFAIHTSTARVRQHPARGVGRDHALGQPPRRRGRAGLRRAVGAASRARSRRAPLVVWDVGLGAAHNAMALIRALDAAPGHAPVELVSFEHDLDALRLALAHTKEFAHLRHPAPHLLAAHGALPARAA